MTKNTFRERIQKTYTKKDLEKALGLKNKAQLQKRIDKLVDIYKVDMKKFQKILAKVKELLIVSMGLLLIYYVSY
ncbi:hypothetical protein [Staphylococcus aureus]|uniref:hypothetical protein n=1 Tax=Staphylococcus aureus TaxID=1280 RepID=UPI000D1B7EE6|nr:hypothetical protein [Staphylococcus aureus]HDE3405998.1 hypothetical protein [Staphylococcus aureus]HDE4083317.1 hypothetical protein [Staphylococcus aureus]